MNLYEIDPRDALCFTDGRGSFTGALRTLPFPWPSSLAGLVRTRVGSNAQGIFEKQDLTKLRAVAVRGPWLLRWSGDNATPDWFVPAPRDCVWMEGEGNKTLERHGLAPMTPPVGCNTSLPDEMKLVGPVGTLPRTKPRSGPAFWSWREATQWLLSPKPRSVNAAELASGGTPDFLAPLPIERRVHVAITPGGTTALDGALFVTHGVRFALPQRAPRAEQPARAAERLGLGFCCEDPRLRERTGPMVLGGERRPAFLRSLSGQLPALPAELAGSGRSFRVVLLTPGIFNRGFAPEKIRGASVVAAVVPRPEVVSGWDYERGTPKPTRRVVPAGSVYWVTLPDSIEPKAWLQEVWMNCISDNEQDRNDGFGLAMIGVAS